MANNRIYLTCKKCGDGLFLGKTYGEGYFFDTYGGDELGKRLNRFYDEHDLCGENCFEIKYDNEPDEADKDLEVIRNIKPAWIPCSERMPEEEVNVLLTWTYEDYEPDVLVGHLTKYMEPCFEDWADEYTHELENVPAWMPLPEPYREEYK